MRFEARSKPKIWSKRIVADSAVTVNKAAGNIETKRTLLPSPERMGQSYVANQN
jgi:hypothetical protein